MKTQCPHCKSIIEADDQWISLKASCPTCNKDFIVAPFIEEREETKCECEEGETVDLCPYCKAIAPYFAQSFFSTNYVCPYCTLPLSKLKRLPAKKLPINYDPPFFVDRIIRFSHRLGILCTIFGILSAVFVWLNFSVFSTNDLLLGFTAFFGGLLAGFIWFIPYAFFNVLVCILKSLHAPKI